MSTTLAPGLLIAGRYRLDRLIGRGGMGQVWAATHDVTLRTTALKFLNGPVHERPDLRRRFLREARAASAVHHPNVVQIHDFFELEDGTPVMIMDLLLGETLGDLLVREGQLGLSSAADVLLPVVSAVGTAHAMGIVHRDLKPHNVFLAATADGTPDVRVLDFGIAKLSGSEATTADPALTETGMMLGTPCYMSPEQSFGEKDIDHRTDVWAIGVMLYETLSGVRPLDGENAGQVFKRLATEVITPLEVLAPDLPRDVTTLVSRMLTRDLAGRPADLREVLEVLAAHGTVTVPAFGPAVRERPPIVDSSPMSQRSSPRASIPSRPPTPPDSGPRTKESVAVGNEDTDVAPPPPASSEAEAPSRPATLAIAAVVLAFVGYAALHFSARATTAAAGSSEAAAPRERAVTGRATESAAPDPTRAVAAAASGNPIAAPLPPEAATAHGGLAPARPQPAVGTAPRGVRAPEPRDPGKPATAKAPAAAPAGSEGLIDEPPF